MACLAIDSLQLVFFFCFVEEHHELSGRAKDFGSAMVFMNILAAAVRWSCVCLSIFFFD